MRNFLVTTSLLGFIALSTMPAHATMEAFQDGQRDRKAWEEWYNGLAEGEYRNGASYWAERRNKPGPKSCYASDGKPLGEMTNGCLAAQRRLASIDVRRMSEPDYRAGFNTYKPEPKSQDLDISANNQSQTFKPFSEPAPTPSTQIKPPSVRQAETLATIPQTRPATPSSFSGSDLEERLVNLVREFSDRYRQANNDMVKGSQRPARAKAICSILRDLKVQSWTGKIEKMTTNGDGKGVLSIRISENIVVKTWNNSLSDISDETLISPNSALYSQLLQLKEGHRVVFNGILFLSNDDCLKETSMTMGGAMRDPEFLIRFSEVSPLH